MGRVDAQDDLAVAGRFVVISGSSRVRLLPVDGSAERILAESKRDNFRRAAVHGSQVFVVREVDGRLGPEPVVREIIRIAISGPQPPEVIHRTRGPVHHLAVDDRRLFFIAADPSGSRERVESVDLDRKEHRLLWSRIGPIDNLVLHEAHVYFSADDRILRIGKDAGAPALPAPPTTASADAPEAPLHDPTAPPASRTTASADAPLPDAATSTSAFVLTVEATPIEGPLAAPTKLTAKLRNRSASSQIVNRRMLINNAGQPGEILLDVQGPKGFQDTSGFRVRVGEAGNESFVSLAPGQVIEESWPLDRYVHLDRPGAYDVRLTYHNETTQAPDGRPLAACSVTGHARIERR